MFIKKVINKIFNLDKIAELEAEMRNQEKDIRCYQRANRALKDEIEQLIKEISQRTDCAIGSWCNDCKHLKYATSPNEQQMIKNAHDCFASVYDISQEFYYIKYCGKHTHEFCKEWEAQES